MGRARWPDSRPRAASYICHLFATGNGHIGLQASRVAVKPMATTEDIAEHQQESGKRTTSSLGDGIERAMADADKRLTRLMDKLHRAARGSAAFEGAQRDAKRVLDWLQAKSHELESELQKVAHNAGAAVKNGAARKEPREPDEPAEPEPGTGGATAAELRNLPDTMGG